MRLFDHISQLCSLYFLPFLFHQFAFALGYLNCWSLIQRNILRSPKSNQEFSTNRPSYSPITITQIAPLLDPETKQEFFKSLPAEIIIDILSNLPIRTILNCKCVCKSWLNFIKTNEFVESHLSKSAPGFFVFEFAIELKECKVFEFKDGLDPERHDLHYNLITKFKLPFHGWMCGSANGLLFLRDVSYGRNTIYICNPITRDYIKLPCPQKLADTYSRVVTYGFGASEKTSQYKIVRIFQDCKRDKETGELLKVTESECEVYTLGTGYWRSIAPGAPLHYHINNHGEYESNRGVCVNGNLHWLAFDLSGSPRISCVDLETERFRSFSAPPLLYGLIESTNLSALGNCLCLCDNTSGEIVIWLMKEYGVERSWTKEFVISKDPSFARWCYEARCSNFPFESNAVYPIKIFEDGDILMSWSDILVFYYSDKAKTTQKLDMFEQHTPADSISLTLLTPCFLSLKTFEMENVRSV